MASQSGSSNIEVQLRKLANSKIVKTWKKVGLLLGYKWEELYKYRLNHDHIEEGIFEMLIHWYHNYKGAPTVESPEKQISKHLNEALQKALSTAALVKWETGDIFEDLFLYQISENLGDAWKKVGLLLGFSHPQLENIERDNARNVSHAAMDVLVRWRQNSDLSKNRFSDLLSAVKEGGCFTLAAHLQRNIAISDFLINPNQISYGAEDTVGCGGYSEVLKATYLNQTVAVKILYQEGRLPEKVKADLLKEAIKMHTIHHPNVVTMMGIITDDINKKYGLVMEYMEHGSIKDVLEATEEEMDWAVKNKIAQDICRGMTYMHAKDLVHRDLKSSNVLIDNNFTAKVSDFGISRFCDMNTSRSLRTSTSARGLGTVTHSAPEVFYPEDEDYRPKKESDVYSFGIIVFELCANKQRKSSSPHKRLPFEDNMTVKHITAYVGYNKKNPITVEQKDMKIPDDCPLHFLDIMDECVDVDLVKRPTFAALYTRLNEVHEEENYVTTYFMQLGKFKTNLAKRFFLAQNKHNEADLAIDWDLLSDESKSQMEPTSNQASMNIPTSNTKELSTPTIDVTGSQPLKNPVDYEYAFDWTMAEVTKMMKEDTYVKPTKHQKDDEHASASDHACQSRASSAQLGEDSIQSMTAQLPQSGDRTWDKEEANIIEDTYLPMCRNLQERYATPHQEPGEQHNTPSNIHESGGVHANDETVVYDHPHSTPVNITIREEKDLHYTLNRPSSPFAVSNNLYQELNFLPNPELNSGSVYNKLPLSIPVQEKRHSWSSPRSDYEIESSLELDRNTITDVKNLFNGKFSTILVAMWGSSKEVALKKNSERNERSSESFMQEATALDALRHPNIAVLYGLSTTKKPYYIVMKLMNSDLLTLIRKSGVGITLWELSKMVSQILHGLSFIEAKNYVHRSVRASNILVAENFECKVSGFRRAVYVGGTKDKIYTSHMGIVEDDLPWAAPETQTDGCFSIKSDVWAFGVTLCEIFTYGHETSASSSVSKKLQTMHSSKGHDAKLKSSLLEEICEIHHACCQKKKDLRPTFAGIKKSFDAKLHDVDIKRSTCDHGDKSSKTRTLSKLFKLTNK